MLCASDLAADVQGDTKWISHNLSACHIAGGLGCWHAWRLCLMASQQCSLCAILCNVCSLTAGTEECLVQPGYHELGNTAGI